jgi:acetolactate synthase-1/2/3 large subunit
MLSDEVDLLIIVGTSLGELQTYGWEPKLVANRTVVQIDIDPLEIGKNYPVDASVVGDAYSILTDLAEILCSFDQSLQQRDNLLLGDICARQERYYQAEQLQGDAEVLKPSALAAKMSEILPAETLLFGRWHSCNLDCAQQRGTWDGLQWRNAAMWTVFLDRFQQTIRYQYDCTWSGCTHV